MTTYKWLRPDHRGAYGHGDYTAHLPHGTRPGKWLPAVAAPKPCARGYHVVDIAHLPAHWGIAGVLYEAETRGKTVEDGDKLACESIRLVRRVGELTPGIAATFAADCAERVLGLFEAKFPDDDRPRKAIEAARACIADPTPENRAAWDAARAAVHAARYARAAVRAAVYAARYAGDAAWAAAWAAAVAAGDAGDAGDAARAAVVAARYAWDAAWDAAWAVAVAAGDAGDAARAAEREWQGAHLIELLEAAS
jgi:hypothetical protein